MTQWEKIERKLKINNDVKELEIQTSKSNEIFLMMPSQ